MKTLFKIVLAGFVLLVLAIVGLVVLGLRMIDSIAAEVIERGGTYALGVETDVEGADVGLLGGTFSMDRLTVGNPEGYPSDWFMEVPSLDVALDTGTVTSDVIVLPTLSLGTVGVTLDGTAGTPNYRVILDNLKRFESGGGGDEPADPSSDGPKFVINSLVIEGAAVKVTNFTGVQQITGDVDVAVERIELKDVGSAEPLSASELVSLIVKTVMSATVENAGGILPADLLDGIRGQLEGLIGLDALGIEAIGDVGAIRDTLRGAAEDAIDDVRDKAEEEIRGVVDGLIGGGGKKDEDDDGP